MGPYLHVRAWGALCQIFGGHSCSRGPAAQLLRGSRVLARLLALGGEAPGNRLARWSSAAAGLWPNWAICARGGRTFTEALARERTFTCRRGAPRSACSQRSGMGGLPSHGWRGPWA